MSEPKFLRGPYRYDYAGQMVWAGQVRIADMRGWSQLSGQCLSEEDAVAIMDANGHLFAASHTMYEALLVCRDAINHFVPIVGEVGRTQLTENEVVALDAMLHIVTALKMARGETPDVPASEPDAFESEGK